MQQFPASLFTFCILQHQTMAMVEKTKPCCRIRLQQQWQQKQRKLKQQHRLTRRLMGRSYGQLLNGMLTATANKWQQRQQPPAASNQQQ